MAATTTMTSLASGKNGPKALCSICDAQPATVVCQCGQQFDYHCISQHVDHMSREMQDLYRQISEKFNKINQLQEGGDDDFDIPHSLVENWVCIKL